MTARILDVFSVRGIQVTLDRRDESVEQHCLLTLLIVIVNELCQNISIKFDNLISKNVHKGLQFLWIKKIISGSDRPEFCSNNGFEETKG